jgi:hypothetical protein
MADPRAGDLAHAPLVMKHNSRFVAEQRNHGADYAGYELEWRDALGLTSR